MGTAHIEAKQELVDKINLRSDVFITDITNFGEGFFLVKVESEALPDGYHGLQNLYFEDDTVKFRKDLDV
jgi:hypothetical protein